MLHGNLLCQQIPLSKEYLVNSYSLSPAYAGINGGLEAFFQTRRNLLGQVNAPEINKISINGSVFNQVGAGLNLLEYSRGVFKTISFETSYSYQIHIREEHILSFGLSAILLSNRIDLASIDDLGDDPYFTFESDFRSTNFNAGAGIVYLYKDLRLGISAPLLLENRIKSNGSVVYNTGRTLGLHAGYVVRYNSLSFYPMITSHHYSGNSYWEGSILCQVRNTLWGGLSFGKNGSAGICLGGAPISNVIINYSYELSGNVAKGAYTGSHELNIGILIHKRRKYGHNKPSMFKAYNEQPYYKFLDR
jgi:type IX secretion system PorP/SprF family membrane protein